MDKKEIFADLRAQFGNVSVLYAKEIAVLLSKPSTGAMFPGEAMLDVDQIASVTKYARGTIYNLASIHNLP